MDTQYCKDCAHFRQHYTFNNKTIFRVYCGHCTEQRVKRKRPDDHICEQFTPELPTENPFATKEYLSKELLQYMLQLDLLPEIEDAKEI